MGGVEMADGQLGFPLRMVRVSSVEWYWVPFGSGMFGRLGMVRVAAGSGQAFGL